MRRIVVTMAGILVAGAAQAADDITTAGVGESQRSYPKANEVAFVAKDCEEECHVASLLCDENRSISLVYADVDSQTAAKAITVDQQPMTLMADGKSFMFSISEMQFMEMSGTWWLTAGSYNDPFELLKALQASKTIKVTLQTQSMDLPVTADVKTWAAACAR